MKATFKNICVALSLLAMVMVVLLAIDKASSVAVAAPKTYVKVTVIDLDGKPVHKAKVSVGNQTFFTDNKGLSSSIELTDLTNCYDSAITEWHTATVIVTAEGYVPSIVFNCVLYDGQTRKLTVKAYPVDSSELSHVSYVESPPDEYVKSLLGK